VRRAAFVYDDAVSQHVLRDGQAPPLSAEVRDFTERFAQDTVDRVKRLIFPVHGIA
jgi:hypothetical protein